MRALPKVCHFDIPQASLHDESQEAMFTSAEDTSMILDTGCTKAMKNRKVFHRAKAGLHGQNIEILPDASTFNFANGQQALAKEKCCTRLQTVKGAEVAISIQACQIRRATTAEGDCCWSKKN